MESQQLQRIEDRLAEVGEDVSAILRELGGITPGGPKESIRWRLHTLENAAAAEHAAESALSAIKAERSAHSSQIERRAYGAAALILTIGNVVLAHFLK